MISGLNSHVLSKNVILSRNRIKNREKCIVYQTLIQRLNIILVTKFTKIPGLGVKILAQTNMILYVKNY